MGCLCAISVGINGGHPEDTRVPEKTTSDFAGKVRDDGLDGSWVLTRLAPDCIGVVADASRDGTWVSARSVPVTAWVVSDAVPDGSGYI